MTLTLHVEAETLADLLDAVDAALPPVPLPAPADDPPPEEEPAAELPVEIPAGAPAEEKPPVEDAPGGSAQRGPW